MARTSADFSPVINNKLIKARQQIKWMRAELEAYPELLEQKKNKKLNAVIKKYNKQLEGAAFAACDKGEYFDFEADKRIQKYDVKNYMKHRALNHGFAKKVFRCIKSNTPWQELLKDHTAKYEALRAKRTAFCEEISKQKQQFIEKNATDATSYDALKAELDNQLAAYEAELDRQNAEKLENKTLKLNARIQSLELKIEELKAKMPNPCELPDDVLLTVKGLKMYFGGLKAVDDLSFDVKKGEIFGLIGPNGAGKTTVFNCITRFYNATDGEMYFENKQGEVVDLRNFKVHDVILQGISRTFQNVELVKEISVLDNLLVACTREYRSNLLVQALGLPSLKREEKMLRAKAMKILKFMGIESYAAWLAMGLPYGILKKVEIARALMSDAKLIIMDEPAAGLNDTETAELTRTIRRIRDTFNVTILLVEHDMSLVMNVCDTICAISFGKMLDMGTPDQIKRSKVVQEAYLGVEEDEE